MGQRRRDVRQISQSDSFRLKLEQHCIDRIDHMDQTFFYSTFTHNPDLSDIRVYTNCFLTCGECGVSKIIEDKARSFHQLKF